MDNKFNLNLPTDFYKNLLDRLTTGVYFVDYNRNIIYWNGGAEELTGYTRETVMGHFCGSGFLNHVDSEGVLLCGEQCPLLFTIQDGVSRQANIFMKHSEGFRIPVQIRTQPLFDEDGKIVGAVEFFEDISPRLAAHSKIASLNLEVNTDMLTQIANRRYIEKVIEQGIIEYEQFKIGFGVIFLDMDGLKEINDLHGHSYGDNALVLIAKTLNSFFREGDYVGRWGGDEFIIVLKNIGEEGLKEVSRKVQMVLGALILQGENFSKKLSVSVGKAMAKENDSIDSLVKRADQSMYLNKKTKSDYDRDET